VIETVFFYTYICQCNHDGVNRLKINPDILINL